MRYALAQEPMAINDESRVITCSYGATCWRPGLNPDSEALIRIADEALYEAKREGRNRVVYRSGVREPDKVIG